MIYLTTSGYCNTYALMKNWGHPGGTGVKAGTHQPQSTKVLLACPSTVTEYDIVFFSGKPVRDRVALLTPFGWNCDLCDQTDNKFSLTTILIQVIVHNTTLTSLQTVHFLIKLKDATVTNENHNSMQWWGTICIWGGPHHDMHDVHYKVGKWEESCFPPLCITVSIFFSTTFSVLLNKETRDSSE